MKRFVRLPKTALAVLLCCTIIACTSADVARYITLIGQFAANALTLVAAFQGKVFGVNDMATLTKFEALAQKVNTDIQNAYTAYQADHATGQPILVAALQAAETQLPAFLADAQISNTDLQARIEGVTTALLMSAESIAAFFPQAAPAPPLATITLKAGHVYKIPKRVKMSPSAIKTYWNAAVCQGITACVL